MKNNALRQCNVDDRGGFQLIENNFFHSVIFIFYSTLASAKMFTECIKAMMLKKHKLKIKNSMKENYLTQFLSEY